MLTNGLESLDLLAHGDPSQGALAVIESTLSPEEAGPPLHVHPSLDVTFYVLGGRIAFRVGDVSLTALPGASVFAARGTPHTYANESGSTARLLILYSPGVELMESPGTATANDAGAQVHRTDIVRS
jgi:quercetin dioxygenase-like cupin family protein